MGIQAMHRLRDAPALARVSGELDGMLRRLRDEDRLPAFATPSHTPVGAPDIDNADWLLMLGALAARLRQLGGQPSGDNDQIQIDTLDCAEALDSLHASLGHRLGRANGHAHAVPPPDLQPPTPAVMYVDLGGLVTLSMLHGQEGSGELLEIVNARLVQVLRSNDRVSHLGGDVFVGLLSCRLDGGSLGRLAARVFDAASAPVSAGRLKFSVRPSIGLAIYPCDGVNATTLLANANAAMARAKRLRMEFAFYDRNSDR